MTEMITTSEHDLKIILSEFAQFKQEAKKNKRLKDDEFPMMLNKQQLGSFIGISDYQTITKLMRGDNLDEAVIPFSSITSVYFYKRKVIEWLDKKTGGERFG
ncbi:hypothetical protein N6G95_09765 [Pediococcus inopinatus]|uniref:hypothetical protein n=1 Tax=Pediococcus inopinatus TaxID=114090 RepID=UPI002B256F1F|nr:hypothetical protein [Pediococcus inopinatus]WPC19489.1 hypothetical protein N6G95_09765 [Pediococcus inopinatus]